MDLSIFRHLNECLQEIENGVVWEQIALMIDSELFKATSIVEASLVSIFARRETGPRIKMKMASAALVIDEEAERKKSRKRQLRDGRNAHVVT
jgi:hypothetical protein